MTAPPLGGEGQPQIPVIRTERLVLRDWRDTDRAPFAELNADAEVMRHFPSTLTTAQSSEMVDSIMAGWSRRGFGLWAVERLDTGAFIGFIGLSSPSWSAEPLVEVGWRLARSSWGNGFAPEGARAALDHGFSSVRLPGDEIVSFTTVGNSKSRRVMEKIGMRHDPARDFDHPLLPDWEECRHVLYAITADEHRAEGSTGVAR